MNDPLIQEVENAAEVTVISGDFTNNTYNKDLACEGTSDFMVSHTGNVSPSKFSHVWDHRQCSTCWHHFRFIDKETKHQNDRR
jgi:hypothetical protein